MTKQILTEKGESILVDDEDYEHLSRYSWHVIPAGYCARSVRGTKVYMHRMLIGLTTGDGIYCDHINGNKLDNRRSNLRPCTCSENHRNKPKQSNNKTGFKGVTWHARARKYVAMIRIHGRTKYLGSFDDPLLAHELYCLAADMSHGEFAHYGE